jgi:transposase
LVGGEGTGAYGAGLARSVREHGVALVEVDRPDRKTRRWQGKSDPVDAEAAARAALAARATGTPKQRDGRVEALRALRVARRSAIRQRADVQRQMHTLVVTAPEPVRSRLRDLRAADLVAHCAAAPVTVGLVGGIGRRVLDNLLPDRRLRVSPRIVKRAISKYQARGPNINRRTYKATLNINILVPAGP